MSVSSELLCSFELLKPLDSDALKSHIKKGRNKRNQLLNSPVSFRGPFLSAMSLTNVTACECISPERLSFRQLRDGQHMTKLWSAPHTSRFIVTRQVADMLRAPKARGIS